MEFLDNVHSNQTRPLQYVLEGVKDREHLAGIKALGLVEKMITFPLWRLIEGQSHILEMKVHYGNFIHFQKEASKDASAIARGEKLLFPNPLMVILLEESDVDNTVQQFLQMTFISWVIFLKRALVEPLLARKFVAASPDYMHRTRFCRPNDSILTNEAFFIFTLNKMRKCLEEKTEERRNSKPHGILTKKIKSKFGERKDNI